MSTFELLYVRFMEHPFLEGLEINFSNEFEFYYDELNNKIRINEEAQKKLNLFQNEEHINNISVLVGCNGTGKTTIIQKIQNELHGPPNSEFLSIIKKKNKIILNYPNEDIIEKQILNDSIRKINSKYNLIINKSGAILSDIKLSSDDLGVPGDNLSMIYYTDHIDDSIKSYEHIIASNFAFDFSPFHVLNDPNTYLDISQMMINSLARTTSNYSVITMINIIKFLNEFKGKKLVDFSGDIFISFNNFKTNILNRYGPDFFEKSFYKIEENIKMLFEGDNEWINVLNVHIISYLQNLLNISDPVNGLVKVDSEFYEKQKNREFESPDLFEKAKDITKDDYDNKVKDLFDNFSKSKKIDELKNDILELLNNHDVFYFYSIDNKKIDFTEELKNLFISYQNLIKYDEGKPSFIFNLREAYRFLINYLTLRNKTDTRNYTTFFMPDKLTYMKDSNDFYFSTGESSYLRLYSSINLAKKRILNLLSNRNGFTEKTKYPILLLLDEPNNAMHPNMQRAFISNLVDYLNSPMFDNFEFQVVITTHSPIITGDLTSSHVIRLKKENSNIKVDKVTENKTFAQNIYTLYKDSFYMEDGLVGKYAEKIIGDVQTTLEIEDNSIENLNDIIKNEYTIEDMELIIEEIGEPIIRKHFENMLEEKIKDCDSEKCLKEIIENSNINPEKKERLLKELED